MSNMYFMWSSVSESNGVRLNRQPAQKSLELGMAQDVTSALEEAYRSDWGRIVAALIGLFGDFDAAEEAAQEAFGAAVDQWPASGVPEFPRAWIIQTARHKAIDRMRRQGRFRENWRPMWCRGSSGPRKNLTTIRRRFPTTAFG